MDVWIGFGDFQFDEVWWLNEDWFVILQGDYVGFFVFQLFFGVVYVSFGGLDLFEGFWIYEVLVFVVVVYEVYVGIDDVGCIQ